MHKHTQTHMILLLYIVNVHTSLLQNFSYGMFYYLQYKNKFSIIYNFIVPQNSPNDLQLLSDAPAHHIFVLLPPVTASQTTLPDVLCVIQVGHIA